MNKLGSVLVALVVVACSRGSRAPRTAASCDGAAANAGRVFAAAMNAASDDLTPIIARHCTDDAWSPAAIACMTATADHDGLQSCANDALTPAQRDAVEHDLMAAMPGAREATMQSEPYDGNGVERDQGKAFDDPCGGEADGATDDPCGGGE